MREDERKFIVYVELILLRASKIVTCDITEESHRYRHTTLFLDNIS